MPEGKDHSWNFVEIDSASDLMAMEHVDSDIGLPRGNSERRAKDETRAPREAMARNKIATKSQARLKTTRSGGKEKFRRKKGLRRRVKGRNKLARLDDEETHAKEASGQTVGEENRANDVKIENYEKEVVELVKHSRQSENNMQREEDSKLIERAKNNEEPFVSSLAEGDLANKEWEQVSRKAEERSYGEERDYYPSGPRREQLLGNERAFLTSPEKGNWLSINRMTVFITSH